MPKKSCPFYIPSILVEMDKTSWTFQCIDKIVMLTHMQQSSIELALIGKLTDVDVIVAGGSGSTLFDLDNTETTTDDIYSTTNLGGDPAFVVSVEGDYRRVGQLDLSFDDDLLFFEW